MTKAILCAYTSSDSDGNITIVSGAPSNADPKLELEGALEVTHTLSSGRKVNWTSDNGTVFFAGMDYSRVEAKAISTYIALFEQNNPQQGFQTQALLYGADCVLSDFVEFAICTMAKEMEDAGQTLKWPNGIIYYQLDSNLTTATKEAIRYGVRVWNEALAKNKLHADIKWVEGTPATGRVIFRSFNKEGVCGDSRLGYSPSSSKQLGLFQYLNINSTDCLDDLKPTVVHEMGHVMGLMHEHERCDRPLEAFVGDRSVYIDFIAKKNIIPSKLVSGRLVTASEFNILKDEVSIFRSACNSYFLLGIDNQDNLIDIPAPVAHLGPFDKYSVMHYDLLSWFSPSIDKYVGFRFKGEKPADYDKTSNNLFKDLTSMGYYDVPSTNDALGVTDLYREN